MTMEVARGREQHDGAVTSPGGTRRRARKAASGVDYKLLAGESTVPSPENSNKDDSSSSHHRKSMHANRHVIRIVDDTFDHRQDILQTVTDGSALTSAALLDPTNSLTIHRPILVTDSPESIGMRVPRGKKKVKGGGGGDGDGDGHDGTRTTDPDNRITIRGIGITIGLDHPVTVMDVRTQEEMDGWTMADLVDYFEDEDRKFHAGQTLRTAGGSSSSFTSSSSSRPPPRVLNQISLEFSHTPLLRQTRSPQFVRDLDWIDNLWPCKLKAGGDYPVVQYYCLTSTAGCYTDFHIDFGGTSVWYHVLSGQKVFLLAPPTPSNMAVYESWLCRPDQGSVFYPDLDGVEGVIKVTLQQDQTLLIPSGWIHAVYTPVDSIVVGGNFLHGLAMDSQLDVHCVETRTRVPAKFRFPHFIRMMFYAGAGYLERMRAGNICKEEVRGMRRLGEALRSWTVAPGGDAGGGARSVAGTAAECASRVGCRTATEMVDAILAEVDRIELDTDGSIVPRSGYVPTTEKVSTSSSPGGPKLKLSLKVGGGGSSPPPRTSPSAAESGASPRPKIKLRLGGLGAMLQNGDDDDDEVGADAPARAKAAAAAAAAASTVESKGSTEDAKEDEDDDDNFRITVSSSSATSAPSVVARKKRIQNADLDPYRSGTVDPGDEEWMPESEKRRSKKKKSKLSLSLGITPPLSIDSAYSTESSPSSSRSPLRSPKSNAGGSESIMSSQQQQQQQARGRVQNRLAAAAAASRPKKVLSARERLKKKMKF